MSDKEKQIEEMAEFIHVDSSFPGFEEGALQLAEELYKAGYRKQVEGENIGTVHPVDEFKCSVCGITLEGWTRVVTDEDDGELYYYEYEFKYCPNCGAKMKGGESDA